MKAGKSGALLLIGALFLSVLMGACTPNPSKRVTPTLSSTPTPPETSREEAERVAFAAVEKSYVDVLAERNRLYQTRGSGKPTNLLKDLTAGKYLKFLTEDLEIAHNEKYVATSPVVTIGVMQRVGLSGDGTRLSFRVCEDFRKVKLKYSNGNIVTPTGTRLYLQAIKAELIEGVWKLDEQSSTEISSGGERCGD